MTRRDPDKAEISQTATDIRRAQMHANEAARGPDHVALMETRRQNMRAQADLNGGLAKMAIRLGYSHPSYLSQTIGINPSNSINETTARDWEKKLGLPRGAVDRPFFGTKSKAVIGGGRVAQTAPSSPVAATPPIPIAVPTSAVSQAQIFAEVVHNIFAEMENTHILLDDERVGKLIFAVKKDAEEHGGHPRKEFISTILGLIK